MSSRESSDERVRSDCLYQEDIVTTPGVRKLLAVARIVLGCFFLWPFLDTLFGLGYATPVGQGWIAGTPPATWASAST